MKKYLLLLLFVSLFLNLSAFEKKSIIERYTNSSCVPCANINNAWYNYSSASMINSGSVTHIVYNVNWPSAQDPMYLFNSNDNRTRWTYYGVNAVPWVDINGARLTDLTQNGMESAVTYGNSQFSPFKIVLTSERFPNNFINVKVSITRDAADTLTYTNTRLKVGLTERTVEFPSPLGNGERIFYSITRKMLPDGKGILLDAPAPGATVIYNLSLDPSAAFLSTVKMDSVRVVAFIQNDGTKEIYQSEMQNLTAASHAFTFTPIIDFKDVEITSGGEVLEAVLYNWSTSTLSISNITSEAGPFKLQDVLTYPVSVPVNGSLTLHFKFTPTTQGVFTENFAVTSNDPVFTGFVLEGRGFKVDPASDNKLYGASGKNNNGSLLTIDPTSGAGTNVGASSYEELRGIAINPVTKTIYGLSSDENGSIFLKVNAPSGDAFTWFFSEYTEMGSIAFDKSGKLYAAQRSGAIYLVNLETKALSMVCSSHVKLQSIAFSPMNNELWGTVYVPAGSNKDRVVKINLTNGEITDVGKTGFNIMTNAISFDKAGNLFGVTGNEGQINSFISIDKTTGVGALVGSIGLKNITSIVFTPENLTSVPTEGLDFNFSLGQNYPNPFNPVTSITYSVRESGNVSIKVYDVLGRLVSTLVNEVKAAGQYRVDFNGLNLSSGVYIYKMEAGNFTAQKKLLLLK